MPDPNQAPSQAPPSYTPEQIFFIANADPGFVTEAAQEELNSVRAQSDATTSDGITAIYQYEDRVATAEDTVRAVNRWSAYCQRQALRGVHAMSFPRYIEADLRHMEAGIRLGAADEPTLSARAWLQQGQGGYIDRVGALMISQAIWAEATKEPDPDQSKSGDDPD